jgi:hypothetical protein
MAVVAVIALLLAMLIPSLGQARLLAYDAICKNNLNKLSVAVRTPMSGPMSKLPIASSWLGTVTTAGAAGFLVCPLDKDYTGVPTDITDVYILHNHSGDLHFYYLTKVFDGTCPDTFQLHAKGYKVTKTYSEPPDPQSGPWGTPFDPSYQTIVTIDNDAGIRISWGPQIKIESLKGLGGMGSNHWLCKGIGGSANWQKEVVLRLWGNNYTIVDPPITLTGNPCSYAMNNQVRQDYGVNSQLLLLEYKNQIVADVDGKSPDDVLDDLLAPRHFGRANLVTVDGAVQSLRPYELQSDDPIWKDPR